MKRIISLVMSVLMIMTMFCGFATTSTAADIPAVPAEVNVVYEDNGDGTFEVSWYVDDYTPYGWHRFDMVLVYDDACEPVLKTVGNGSAYFRIWYAYQYFNVKLRSLATKNQIAGTAFNTTEVYLANGTNQIAIDTQLLGRGAGWSSDFITNVAEANPAEYAYSDEYGFLMASATFKLKEGETSATIGADILTANVALSDQNGDYSGLSDTITVNSATIKAAEKPNLPAGITLNVEDGASIRTADPAGMRFYADVTADDFFVISEMGVAIVKENGVPGSDTTLKIPARVNTSGEYLQYYNTDDAGKKTFIDGVKADYNGTTVEFTGVLSNIKDTNLDQNFTAYAYVIVDGETYYSEAVCTRSYTQVETAANAEVEDGVVG